MGKYRKLSAGVFALGFFSLQPVWGASGAGSTSANFLKIGMGARPVGMGEVFTGVADDTNAVYWNPAGLALARGVGFTATHAQWVEGVSHEFFAAHANFKEQGALGASFTFLGTGTFLEALETPNGDFGGLGSAVSASDFAAAIAYAQRLGVWFGGPFFRKSSLSLKANVVGQRVVHETGYGLSFDLGYLYEIKRRKTYFGFTASNVGTKIKSFTQPLQVRLGASHTLHKVLSKKDRLLFALESGLHNDTGFRIGVGSEYTLRFGRIAASWRAGYRTPTDLGGLSGLTAGFGLLHPIGGTDVSLDYAYVPFGILGQTHRVSLSVRLGAGPEPPKAFLRTAAAFTLGKESLPLRLTVKGEEPIAKWRVSILDGTGKIVQIFQGEGEPPLSLKWDGRRLSGKPAEEGRYKAILDVVDLEGGAGRSNEALFDVQVIRKTDYQYTFQFSGDLLFEPGKAELKEKAFLAVAEAARTILQRYPGAKILVAGHTDNKPLTPGGKYKDNWELSRARAEAVQKVLLQVGISKDLLQAAGYADTHPIASNATPEGRAKNRRVELYIMGQKEVGPEELIEEGRALQRTGDFKAALERYVKAAALQPKHPRVYRLIGDVYLALKEKEKALEAYRRHLLFSPEDLDVRGFVEQNSPAESRAPDR